MKDTIYREDAIKAIHNYWKKRLDTLPTKESECGEVYADIQQMDKILEHNKALCNFIEAIPSADRPQGWIPCSERLPEYGVPVLTWDGSMWTVEQRIPFILDDDFNRIYSEWWVDGYFDEDYEDAEYYPNLREGAAVAWMPLPKPWKGADDGKDIQSEVE